MSQTAEQPDPSAESPYGTCNDCGFVAETEESSWAHLRGTMQGGYSHSVHLNHPPRRNPAERAVEDELEEAIERLVNLVERGKATAEDVRKALVLAEDPAETFDRLIAEADL